MASGNKYKSLSVKLYKTLEDLKEMMKAQNNWHQDEINKLVSKNLQKTGKEYHDFGDILKDHKKNDFQRATTFHNRRSAFLSSKGKQPSKIMEEDPSEEVSSELIHQEEAVPDEDKVLKELFRTNVEDINFSQASLICSQ